MGTKKPDKAEKKKFLENPTSEEAGRQLLSKSIYYP